jgi:transmembrane sensor
MKPADSAASSPRDPGLPALDWLHRARAEDELLLDVALKLRRKRRRRLAVGVAALALVAGISSTQLWRRAVKAVPVFASTPKQPALSSSEASTSAVAPPASTATISHPATRVLPDGSTVELNAGADIALAFTDTTRHVTLVRGEAHFQVVSNKARPFVVRAGAVEVRAVGTAFAVQLATQAVDVLVTEGSVRVVPTNTVAADDAPLVAAGRRCLVDVAEMIPRLEDVTPAQTDELLAWRIPQLEFSRAPLAEIVALFNRYAAPGAASLEIADASLRQLKLTGVLRADNTEGLLRLLELNCNVAADRSATRISLHKARD